MNSEDLVELIQDNDDKNEWGEIARGMCGDYGEGPESFEDGDLIDKLEKLGYVLEHEDGEGGREGGGEDFWGVFSVSKNGEEKTYFRLQGFYASHYGSELNDIYSFEKVKKVPVQRYDWVAYKK